MHNKMVFFVYVRLVECLPGTKTKTNGKITWVGKEKQTREKNEECNLEKLFEGMCELSHRKRNGF